jgi:hypothetical protein
MVYNLTETQQERIMDGIAYWYEQDYMIPIGTTTTKLVTTRLTSHSLSNNNLWL